VRSGQSGKAGEVIIDDHRKACALALDGHQQILENARLLARFVSRCNQDDQDTPAYLSKASACRQSLLIFAAKAQVTDATARREPAGRKEFVAVTRTETGSLLDRGQGGSKVEGVFPWIEIKWRLGRNWEDLNRVGRAEFVDELA
jgi:hypothetical protein